MMRSLYSGVAGLKTHQTKMDVIGNNIANVNTVAYKSQSVTFSELLYQTTSQASGPNAATGVGGTNARQIGLGVKSGAINTNITQSGSSQTTNNPFDIQISGDSFFIVNNGSENFFTRDGSFYVDAAGNLCMTSTGYNVMGWQTEVSDTGALQIKQDTVSALRIMSADNLTYPAEATSKAYVSGILDRNDTNVNSSGKIVSLQFYDNLGYKYTAKIKFLATSTDGQYAMSLSDLLDSNGVSVMDDAGAYLGSSVPTKFATPRQLGVSSDYTVDAANHTITYQDGTHYVKVTVANDGTITPTVWKDRECTQAEEDATALAEVDTTNTNIQKHIAAAFGYDSYTEFANLTYYEDEDAETNDVMTKVGDKLYDVLGTVNGGVSSLSIIGQYISGATVQYSTADGSFIGVNGTTNKNVTLHFGNAAGNYSDIAIDLSSSSNVNNDGTSTMTATNGDQDGAGSGRAVGNMSGVTISKSGLIYATYDNGQTKLLGQIAVASFANASGLSKEGDNLYAATQNSGEFDGVGVDISADGSYMTTGALEMSNVDLSAEFTEMITTQRGFQANSRIITVSDTLLEELINLKR
ncbi:MAG: flagellar hook-basal body complex protein [Lachnospiraceae bacterium]|nr:flagellar hook-basal body complex protein [Lachnospiraceae bacterium]